MNNRPCQGQSICTLEIYLEFISTTAPYRPMLALPILAALLIANLALGILTRAAPQLNLFSVGFPVTLLLGFAVLMLMLPQLSSALEKPLQQGVDMMLTLARIAHQGQ